MNLVPQLSTADNNILNLVDHPIFSADSYKYSHYFQLNPSATSMYNHYLNRGGKEESVYFCGLKDIIIDNLTKPLTKEHLYLLRQRCKDHGIPFNEEGFNEIINKYGGLFPVEIRAVPELQSYPLKLPLFTVENTGSATTSWVPGFIETLLMKVYYPSAVATKARNVKEVLKPYFEASSEAPETAIEYAYVNFGNRSATCEKHSTIGAMAHLHHFKATDGFRGTIEHNIRYGSSSTDFVSIPASEHSVVCSNITALDLPTKIEQEVAALLTYVNNCISKGYKLFAWVVDTNDYAQITDLATREDSPIRKALEAAGAKLVLRPDSGDQVTVLTKMFNIMNSNNVFTPNSKGFLTSNVFSVIWGDGTNITSINTMCNLWVNLLKCSMDLLAFGSGGNLVSDSHRDDHKTAIKASSMLLENCGGKARVGISKNPIGDPSKKSMGGRVITCQSKTTGNYYVADLDKSYDKSEDIMQIVYKVG